MKVLKFISVQLLLLYFVHSVSAQTTTVLPINEQTDFVQLYKFAYQASVEHYQSASSTINTEMFAQYGEYSVYLSDDGTFVYPDTLSQKFGNLESGEFGSYDLSTKTHIAVSYSNASGKIAVFKSNSGTGNSTISWQAFQFQQLFDKTLPENAYTFINEETFTSGGISDSVELIVFPAVKIDGQDHEFYVSQIVDQTPGFAEKIRAFVSRGGKIYTEGNGVLFLVKAGLLAEGTVDYSDLYAGDGNSFYSVENSTGSQPVHIATAVCESKLYSNAIPKVTAANIEPYITLSGQSSPVLFSVQDADAKYANQIVANLGLTSALSDGDEKSQQLYTLQSILSFFTSPLDVARNVRNILTGTIIAGDNAIAYDVVDTFTVNIVVRNLSDQALSDISITEEINPYFQFGGIINGTGKIDGKTLSFSGINLAANEELSLSYSLITPDVESDIHKDVDDYLAEGTFISVSENTSTYLVDGLIHSSTKTAMLLRIPTVTVLLTLKNRAMKYVSGR